jgi:TP901 family phage tail tape measure protein
MEQSNTTFEETIGILTAGQTQLQQIEKVSSGLITISTRLRAVTEEGEEIEGLMPNLEKAFAKYAKGVKIQDVNGELRSTYDILVDLSKVWDSMSSKEQSEIGFLVSGTRQTPVLNAILNNLNTTIGATETAINSANSAMTEFEKVQDSTQGKLDRFNATWSRMSTEFLSSGLVNGVIDFGIAVSELVEKLGGLDFIFDRI